MGEIGQGRGGEEGGGRRYRKMKERLGLTEMRKQANRMNFGEVSVGPVGWVGLEGRAGRKKQGGHCFSIEIGSAGEGGGVWLGVWQYLETHSLMEIT